MSGTPRIGRADSLAIDGKGVRLFHFTSAQHLRRIIQDGHVRPSASNLYPPRTDPMQPHPPRSPAVVWLTTCDEPTLGHGLGGVFDKTKVRITMNVPNGWPKRWLDWVRAEGSPQWLIEALAKTGGGWRAAKTWHVVTQPIPRTRWQSVDQRRRDGSWRSVRMHSTGTCDDRELRVAR